QAGRLGCVHPDAKVHRRAVNDTLYGLAERRFAALRSTLLQLRRPKLSDKLDEAGLNEILRNALPPIADPVVADLADGFERLDRHAAPVEDLAQPLGPLQAVRAPPRRYAKAAATARADAVSAAESALDQIRDKATAAKQALKRAKGALARIAGQYTTI